MNFAPYQASPPESTRALSPPLPQHTPHPPPSRSTTASPLTSSGNLPKQSQNINNASYFHNNNERARASYEDPWAAARGIDNASPSPLPSPSAFISNNYDDLEGGRGSRDFARGWGPSNGDYGDGGWTRGGGGGGVGLGSSNGAYVFETSLGIRMDIEAVLAYLLIPPLGGVALLLFERKSEYVRFHAWQSSLVFSALFVVHLLFIWSSFLSWLLFIVDIALILWLVFRAYKDAETLDRLELPFFGPLASRFVDQE